MRRITELTRDELLGLTKEDITNLIKLEAAHQGVRFPGEEPVAPTKPVIDKNERLHKVGERYFTDEKVALEYVAFLANNLKYLRKCDYEYKYGSDTKYVTHLDSWDQDRLTNMEVVYACANVEYLGYKEELEEYKKAKDLYDKQYKEWEADNNGITSIRDEINGIIEEAWEYKRELDKHMNLWNEYVTLAGGDSDQASKFYLKAHSPREEIRAEVLGELA